MFGQSWGVLLALRKACTLELESDLVASGDASTSAAGSFGKRSFALLLRLMIEDALEWTLVPDLLEAALQSANFHSFPTALPQTAQVWPPRYHIGEAIRVGVVCPV